MPSSVALGVIFDELHQMARDGIYHVETEAPQQRKFLSVVGLDGDLGGERGKERAFLSTLTADLDIVVGM